jgi:hypothetical protein
MSVARSRGRPLRLRSPANLSLGWHRAYRVRAGEPSLPLPEATAGPSRFWANLLITWCPRLPRQMPFWDPDRIRLTEISDL